MKHKLTILDHDSYTVSGQCECGIYFAERAHGRRGAYFKLTDSVKNRLAQEVRVEHMRHVVDIVELEERFRVAMGKLDPPANRPPLPTGPDSTR